MDMNFMNRVMSVNTSSSTTRPLSNQGPTGSAGNISELLSSGNVYKPNNPEMKAGMTFTVSNWSQGQVEAFQGLSLEEIHQQVDLTKTTRSEAYEVLKALAKEGQISEETAGSLGLVMSFDQNLDNDAEFNVMEYLEKTMNGFDHNTPALHQSRFVDGLRGLTHFNNGNFDRIVDTYV